MTGLNASFLEKDELRALGLLRCGENVRIHRTAVLVDCSGISIADDVRIDPYVVASASGGIDIGRFVHIGSHCSLSGSEPIAFRDFSCISHGVRLFSSSDDYSGGSLTNATIPDAYKKVDHGRIVLGRHALVGAGSVVLPGVEIHEGSAVGALSLVAKSLPPWGIYAGIPAKRIADRKKDLLELEAQLRDRPRT